MTESSSGPQFVPMPDSHDSQLANYISPPSTLTYLSPGKPRRYHLQPPTIYFTVPTPTSINIALSNSSFKNTANSGEEYKYPSAPTALGTQYPHYNTSLSLTGDYHDPVLELGGVPADCAIMRGTSDLPIKPPDIHTPSWVLPPWSQFPIYNQVDGGDLKHSAYGVVSGPHFPMTAFDLFAQNHKRKPIRSIGWNVVAFPEGGLEDVLSGKIMPNIPWTIKDGDRDQQAYNRTSEIRIYGNFECWGSDNKYSRDAGWWMVEPEKLPTGFSGEAGEHAFLLNSVAEVAAYLNAFMKRCGIMEHVIEVRLTRQDTKQS